MYPIHVLYLDPLVKFITKEPGVDVVVYEFHRPVTSDTIVTAFDEFKNRTKAYYSVYVELNEIVDDWPAQIDHAIRIRGEWFLCLESSSNYYLGSGPSSLLRLRQVCYDKSISIVLMDCNIIEFAFERFQNYHLPSYYNYSSFYSRILNALYRQAADQTKKQKSQKTKSNERFNPEAEFKKINNIIEDAKLSMQGERKKRAKKTETGLRDDLLELINMRLKKVGFAEAKRENGRSDILIPSRTSKRYFFIYECKVGITLPKFKQAVEKLLSEYVAYPCNQAGIIIFNRQASYSEKIAQIPKFVQQTGGIITANEISVNNEIFRCKYLRPSNMKDVLEVFICGINLA